MEKQVFKKIRNHKNQRKFHATTAREKWYANLIDFSARPDGEFKYILIAIDNSLKTMFLGNLRRKTIDDVLEGYKKVEQRAGKAPDLLTTGKETAFLKGEFQDHLFS